MPKGSPVIPFPGNSSGARDQATPVRTDAPRPAPDLPPRRDRRISATWRSRRSFGDRWIEARPRPDRPVFPRRAGSGRRASLYPPASRSRSASRRKCSPRRRRLRRGSSASTRSDRGESLRSLLRRGGLSDTRDVTRALQAATSLDQRRIPAGMPVTIQARKRRTRRRRR